MENETKVFIPIRKRSNDDQPDMKLLSFGAASLSTAELIAIILRTGSMGISAVDLARNLLESCKNNLNELARLRPKEIQRIKGIGISKSLMLCAALELAKRKQTTDFIQRKIVRSSEDVSSYLKAVMEDLPYEVFGVLYLNRANKIIHFEIISRGGITGTIADPRLILRIALEQSATSIVLCHNHPSGNLQPSKADMEITQKIKKSAEVMDIKVIDHIIVSLEGYFSFIDEGLL